MPEQASATSTRPIVRVRVVGGLGNQMFCAAAGMALADRLCADLEFGIDKILRMKQREFGLAPFKLPARLVEGEGWKYSRKLAPLYWLQGLRPGPGENRTTIWRQQGHHFDPSFLALQGNVQLRGFFQSPRYFDNIVPKVRAAFDLKPHLSEAGRKLAADAAGDDSIAIHIRRGDYVSVAANADIFTTLGADYYGTALGLLNRIVARPRVFVVTDDPPAARALLKDIPGLIFAQGTTQFDDMHLISACRHHIIANSSFSWWGAFLDPRPDGLTIAPRHWFKRPAALRLYTDDAYPDGWLIV
jgi:hypothetical protein